MSQHRVLVIGVGSIGERHARCFQQTGRADVSVCDIDPALRSDVAARYGGLPAHADIESAIAALPHAAVVCTPAHLHVEMATRLAERGVHLLVEKPLSVDERGIEQLKQAVKENNLTAAVAYVNRAHPVLQHMHEGLSGGRFGKPLQVVAVSGQNFPFYRPAYREIYYKDRATGGGAIQDALTHLVNAVEWLVGPMTEVAADAAHLALPGVEVEDTVNVIARHGAIPASYSLNQHQPPNESTLTVICEAGVVRFEPHAQRWRWTTKTDEPWHDEIHEPIERDTPFVRQADAFLDALEGTATPLCSLAEGEQTLRCNLAILKSADTHTWQTVGG